MAEPRRITDIADQVTSHVRRQQSKCALNNAIALMAHDFTMAEVAEILRAHADQIDELG